MNAINVFWNWFHDNTKEISNLTNAPVEIQVMQLSWLNTHLKSYCDSIDFVLVFPQKIKAKRKLIFTTSNEESKQKAINLIACSPIRTKWAVSLNDLNATKSAGYAIIQEPVLTTDLPIIKQTESKTEQHVLVHFPKAQLYCHYKHLGHISQITSMTYLMENPATFVRQPEIMEHTNALVHLYQFQFLIDEINRKQMPNVVSAGCFSNLSS